MHDYHALWPYYISRNATELIPKIQDDLGNSLLLNSDAPILFSILYNVHRGDVIGGVLHQPYI